jgi:uncharacterized protein YndB with AHSA1/START domain
MAADDAPIEREVFIPAQPQTVFRFLVEPELIGRWIGRALFATATEGGLFCLQFSYGDGPTAAGVFTEVSPPHRVAFSFGWEVSDAFPPGASHVEIELRSHADGTLVHLKHTGLPHRTDPRSAKSATVRAGLTIYRTSLTWRHLPDPRREFRAMGVSRAVPPRRAAVGK